MNENETIDSNLIAPLNEDNVDGSFPVSEPKQIYVDPSFYTSQNLNYFEKKVGVKNPRCKVVYIISKGDASGGPQVGSYPWVRRNSGGISNENVKIFQAKVICPNSYNQVVPYPTNFTSVNENELDLLKVKLHTTAFLEYDSTKQFALPAINDEVTIEYVGNDTEEARILSVFTKKDVGVPQSNSTTPSKAFNSSDGSTLAETKPAPLSTSDKTFRFSNLCKDSKIIVELANRIGIPPAVMAAFRAVESGGNPSVIRFEPHLFNKNSSIKVPYTNNGKGFSTVASETNKAAFDRAYAINKTFAINSTSWGSYQVLGWALLAVPEVGGDVNKAVTVFYSDPVRISQEIAISWFKRNAKAVAYANNLDFGNLARVYNGPLYANNSYDLKLKQAYEKALAECPEYGGNS